MKYQSPLNIPKDNISSPYNIITCRAGTSGCKNALIDVKGIAEKIHITLGTDLKSVPTKVDKGEFEKRKIPYHLKFKAAIAGCPNSCSQPQVKDFGVSGQAMPIAVLNRCTECMECVVICREKGAVDVIDARPVFDYNLCVMCGDCAKVCPTETIIIAKKGAKVMANGKLGRHPKLADVIAEFTNEKEICSILEKIVLQKLF